MKHISVTAIAFGFLWALLAIPAEILTQGLAVLGFSWIKIGWEFVSILTLSCLIGYKIGIHAPKHPFINITAFLVTNFVLLLFLAGLLPEKDALELVRDLDTPLMTAVLSYVAIYAGGAAGASDPKAH